MGLNLVGGGTECPWIFKTLDMTSPFTECYSAPNKCLFSPLKKKKKKKQ